MRALLLTLLLVTAGLAGCLTSPDPSLDSAGKDEGTDPTPMDVEPGCDSDATRALLTPTEPATLHANAEGANATAQVRLERAGVGSIHLALTHEGTEVWSEEITHPLQPYATHVEGLHPGNHTLTATTDTGVHAVRVLSLEVSWGGGECP